MQNMSANRVARGNGSTFLRGKGRESGMTDVFELQIKL